MPAPGLLAPVLCSLALQGGRFDVPAGFAVEQAATDARSFIALAFDGDGRLFASDEAGGILRLADEDGDGFFERSTTFTDALRTCQGLLWRDDELFVTGLGPNAAGDEVPGLFRLRAETPDEPELLLTFDHFGEHGAHAIALGPDGFLYVTVGDHARIVEAGAPGDMLATGYEGALLPVIDDPGGFGNDCAYPHCFIARVDPESGVWRYHSVGYRNAYDLAFRADGELFTVDSDMEWDVGLPWYQPVRVLHAVPLGDYGRRRASGNWPDGVLDALPPIAALGRGSPTGVVVYEHRRFPEAYRGALIFGDWSRGRILALRLRPDGATFASEPFPEEAGLQLADGAAVLVSGHPLSITDLVVAPDGALYFCTGGRGALGAIHRLTYGEPVVVEAQGLKRVLAQPQLASAWSQRVLREARATAGDEWRAACETIVLDDERSLDERMRAWDALIWTGTEPSFETRLALLHLDSGFPNPAVVRAFVTGPFDRDSEMPWLSGSRAKRVGPKERAAPCPWSAPLLWRARTAGSAGLRAASRVALITPRSWKTSGSGWSNLVRESRRCSGALSSARTAPPSSSASHGAG